MEEGRQVHVEAHVGEGGGDDFGAAVVAILAHLGHEHTGAAAFAGGKILGGAAGLGKVGVIAHALLVDALHGAAGGLVTAPGSFERIGDFAEGGAGAGGGHGQS